MNDSEKYEHLNNTINWYLDFIDAFTLADYLRAVADEIESGFAEFIDQISTDDRFQEIIERLGDES